MGISKSNLSAALKLAGSLKKKSGRTWSCCGLPVEIDHKKAGCTGQAENYGEPVDTGHEHSGEVFMTDAQYRDHVSKRGKVKSARRGKGGYYVIQK